MTTETKKITISELKTFIDAVEFAADLDAGEWVPSERQWRRIRSMIDNLVEDIPPKQAVVPQQPVLAAQPVFTPPPQQNVNRPVQMAQPGLPPPQHAPTPPPTLAMGSSNVPVKTPDIDTSSGTYQSSFGA